MKLQPDSQQNFINFSNALRMTGRRTEAIEITWKAIQQKFKINHAENGEIFEVRTIDVSKC